MPFRTIQYDHDLMNICRSMRPDDTILVDSILKGADLCRRRENQVNSYREIPFQTEPNTSRRPEARSFDPFHSGFNPEADPIIPTSEEYPLRGEISPPLPRRSIVESSDSSSDDEKFRHKPWITENILEMIVVRDRLYQKMKTNPCAETSQTYKKVRNMVVSMTRNAKRAFEKRSQKQAPNFRSKHSLPKKHH